MNMLLSLPRRLVGYAVVLLFLLAISQLALAQETGAPFLVLDAVDNLYRPFQNTWYAAIKGYAINLFWLLALVDFSWSTVVWAMEKNDVTEIAWALVRKIFSLSFFWALLKLSDTWIPAIIDSLRKIGQDVGRTTATPDGVIYKGFEVATGVFTVVGKLGLVESIALGLPVILMGFLILVGFLLVAIQLLVTLIESYLVIGAGVILLGFGGSRWTTDFATKYLQTAFGTGLKLMMIYLIIGAGQTLLNEMVIDAKNLIPSTYSLLIAAAMYAYLAIQIPKLAAAMMSGSPALSAGSLVTTALTMGAAAVGVGAAGVAGAAAMGKGANGAAAGSAGLAKALGAGTNAAVDAGKSGLGAAAHGAGEAAKHGLGLGADKMGGLLGNAKEAFGAKVDNSFGGKIASSIEGTRGGSMSGAGPSSPPPAAPSSQQASQPTSATPQDAPSESSGRNDFDTKRAAPTQASLTLPTPTTSAGPTAQKEASSSMRPSSASSTSHSQRNDLGGYVPQDFGNAAHSSLSADTPRPSSSRSLDPGLKAPIHQKIKDLQGYVPHDEASLSAININMGHTKD